jgi:hypothetical protein
MRILVKRHQLIALSFAALGLAGACSSSDRAKTGDTAAVAAKTDTATGGMSGMAGMMKKEVVDSMRAEMARIAAAAPSDAKAMTATHRQMVANMLSQMNGDMRGMNMTADASWTALVDSVRQDLVRLPDLSGAPLKDFLSAHQGRVERLMAMHEKMMGPK